MSPNLDHPLDRPVWNALASRQAPLALGDGRARRYAPEYGPLAAPVDHTPDSLAALAALNVGGGLTIVDAEALPLPPGATLRKRALLHQMTATALTPGATPFDVLPLADADAPEMLALALLTEPGPFSTATHRLGRFIGVKHDGRLIAMAGERMQPEGFTEVSGVCTHPDHRGRGYAGGLMRVVVERILARGETAFLHLYADNGGAAALYRSLGFVFRREMTMTVLD